MLEFPPPPLGQAMTDRRATSTSTSGASHGAAADEAFVSSTPPAEAVWSSEELAALWHRRRAGHFLLALAATYALAAGLLWALREPALGEPAAGGAPSAVLTQLWVTLAFAPLHVALWWLAARKPVAAVAVGAAAFLLLEVSLLLFDPLGLQRGLYLKVAILLLLYKALREARAGRKVRAS